MSESALIRVERVCTELATSGHPITFTAVAEQAQISRATLYRDQQLRAIVDEHRTRQTDARTLTVNLAPKGVRHGSNDDRGSPYARPL